MRKTRKLNKRYKKTRRGAGRGQLKLLPLLPESPESSAPSSPVASSSPSPVPTNRPVIGVTNANLVPVQKFTYNWYKRQAPKVALLKAREPPAWKKILGIKNKPPPSPVPLNSQGFPIKSFFTPNRNEKNTFKK